MDGKKKYEKEKKEKSKKIKRIKEGGIVIVNDWKKDKKEKKEVPRFKMKWNGDVWKAIVDLRQNKDLDIYTCEMDEGIGIIKKNKNSEILKLDKPINKLKFKDYYNNYKDYLRVISIDEFKEKF